MTQAGAATATGFLAVPLALLSAPAADAATAAHSPAAQTSTSQSPAAQTSTGHSPAGHSPAGHSPAAKRPTGPRLSIDVTDGQTSAKVGDRLTYAVSVRNVGTSAVPHLTVTLTLPPGVPPTSASGHGATAAAKVSWRADVRAGHTETFRATAQVRRPPAQMSRLAAVACASTKGGRDPIVCAADLDRSAASATAVAARGRRAAAPGSGSTVAYAAAGSVAVVGAGALVIIIGRRTRLRRGMRHSG
jgi:uncharacterized repeat protein (TIGR01451 family)